MKDKIPNHLLAELSEFLVHQIGLRFPKNRYQDLKRGIMGVTREFDFRSAEDCVRWLLSSPLSREQIEKLASHLTVGETYFFREKQSFEALENQVLPEMIHSRRKEDKRLRIWSAGCCTGEEPYSIAILLRKMLADWKDWNLSILATDINPQFLKRALKGVYGRWSFRGVPSSVKDRFFKESKEGRFEILPQYKERVSFEYHNLAEDTYPTLFNNTNAMDLIFCRNVIMYFSEDRAKKVVQRLHRCLMPGGWLVVSPCETSQFLFHDFATVNFPGAILYQKVSESRDDTVRVQSIPMPFPTESALPGIGIEMNPDPSGDPAYDIDALYEKQDAVPDGHQKSNRVLVKPRLQEEASLLYEKGRYAEALETIQRLLAEDPGNTCGSVLLARIYSNQGRLSDALHWCNHGITQDKLNPILYHLRANIIQEQGHFQDAISSYKRVLYIDPDFVLAHISLGNLFRDQGKLKESKKHLENALTLLKAQDPESIVPDSDGMTAGRLLEVVTMMKDREE